MVEWETGAPQRPLEAALGSLLATLGGSRNILRFLWVFSSTPGESIPTIWGSQGVIFSDFSRFCLAKVQFAKKYYRFTCIRAILNVCYAGKSATFKRKHNFYLHYRHLRPTLGACYAGKSEGCPSKTWLLPAKQTRDMALMQIKPISISSDFRISISHDLATDFCARTRKSE